MSGATEDSRAHFATAGIWGGIHKQAKTGGIHAIDTSVKSQDGAFLALCKLRGRFITGGGTLPSDKFEDMPIQVRCAECHRMWLGRPRPGWSGKPKPWKRRR